MNKLFLIFYTLFFTTINSLLLAQGGPMAAQNGRGFGRGYFNRCLGYMRGGMGKFMWFVILLLVVAVIVLGVMLYKNNNHKK